MPRLDHLKKADQYSKEEEDADQKLSERVVGGCQCGRRCGCPQDVTTVTPIMLESGSRHGVSVTTEAWLGWRLHRDVNTPHHDCQGNQQHDYYDRTDLPTDGFLAIIIPHKGFFDGVNGHLSTNT